MKEKHRVECGSSFNKSKLVTMKRLNILFWITTGLIFILQGILPIFNYNSPETKQAMEHLGYPNYFGLMLSIFKLLGGLVLIIPQIPKRIKEWAFAGFAIDFICALISFIAVDGLTVFTLFPMIALMILSLSYFAYYKKTLKTAINDPRKASR